ncbi:MAG TPA: hypothetical protein VK190_04565 [Pseudoneobacillus sp.]|nr:hypothetical protein [Pseudoneobacillus sp.]
MFKFRVRGHDKKELVKRIIGLEKRGFECMIPITQEINPRVDTIHRGNKWKDEYRGAEEIMFYTVMRRKQDVIATI